MSGLVVSLAFVVCIGGVSPFVIRAISSIIKKEQDYLSLLFSKCISLEEDAKRKLHSATSGASIISEKTKDMISMARADANSMLISGREEISEMVASLLEEASKQLELQINEDKQKLIDSIIAVAASTTEELIRRDISSSNADNLIFEEFAKHIESLSSTSSS